MGETIAKKGNTEFDTTPNFPKLYINTKLTTKSSDNLEKEIVYDMFLALVSYDIMLKSAELQYVIEILTKIIQKFEILFYQQLKMEKILIKKTLFID